MWGSQFWLQPAFSRLAPAADALVSARVKATCLTVLIERSLNRAAKSPKQSRTHDAQK
jgi:hypothetical protein